MKNVNEFAKKDIEFTLIHELNLRRPAYSPMRTQSTEIKFNFTMQVNEDAYLLDKYKI